MELIEAFADETLFRNDENGYTVLTVRSGKTRVSAVGIMSHIAAFARCAAGTGFADSAASVAQIAVDFGIAIQGDRRIFADGIARIVGISTLTVQTGITAVATALSP